MSGLSSGKRRFGDDDGSAQPGVAAALAAFASGEGSEHAAITSLAGSRLLVPIAAALVTSSAADSAADSAAEPIGELKPGPGEKASEMALPTLVGRDGRRAIPAFTSAETLTRWRPDARPVLTEAALVWRAAVADCCAVVVDIAGPVPIAIDGERLAALGQGHTVPLPFQDRDVVAAVAMAVAGQPAIAAVGLDDGGADCDLMVNLTLVAGCDEAAARQAAAAVAARVMADLGGRLRRGVAVAILAG